MGTMSYLWGTCKWCHTNVYYDPMEKKWIHEAGGITSCKSINKKAKPACVWVAE